MSSKAPVELSMGDANIDPFENFANGVPLDSADSAIPCSSSSALIWESIIEDPIEQLPHSGAAEFEASMGGTAGSEGERDQILQKHPSNGSLLCPLDSPRLLALSPGLPPPGAVPATRRPRAKKREVPPPGAASATRRKKRAKKREEPEKILVLQCMLHAEQEARRGTIKGAVWENVSNRLKDDHDISLDSGQCENFWTSVKRAVVAKRDGNVRDSFYRMFSDECHKLIQQILEYRDHAGPSYVNQPEVQGPQCNAQHSGADHVEPAHTVNSVVVNDHVIQHEAQGTQRNAEPRGEDCAEPFQVVLSTVEDHGPEIPVEDPLLLRVNELIEDAVNSASESPRRRSLEVNSPMLLELLAPEFLQTVKAKITACVLEFLDILLSSGLVFGGDDPVAEVTFLLKKVTDEAVKREFEPIVSVLVDLEEIQKKRKDVMKDRRLLDVKEKALDESERVQHAIGSAYMNRVLRDGHGG